MFPGPCMFLHVNPCLFPDPLAWILSPLADVTVSESDRAEFACKVAPPSTHVKWYIDAIEIYESEKYHIEAQGDRRYLRIVSVAQWDAGIITVDAEGAVSEATLTVQGRII